MKEGGRRKLVIYPEAGYGKAGSPPTIPPNTKLVFDVELLKVNQRGEFMNLICFFKQRNNDKQNSQQEEEYLLGSGICRDASS